MLSPEAIVRSMGPKHPISRSVLVLKIWLAMLSSMLIWNCIVANGILLTGWPRPLPWFVLAGAGVVWSFNPWNGKIVIACSSLLFVGSVLRGFEVLLYADQYSGRGRLTGLSVYLTIGGTSLLIGILNLVVTSRKTAEEWVWERRN